MTEGRVQSGRLRPGADRLGSRAERTGVALVAALLACLAPLACGDAPSGESPDALALAAAAGRETESTTQPETESTSQQETESEGPANLQEQVERARPTFPEVSLDAKLDTFESLMLDLAAERHASDGGGRAWVEHALVMTDAGDFVTAERDERGEPAVFVGRRARFHLVYEVGPEGIAEGGVVFLQVSPFWEWTTPQPDWPDATGYTEVSTDADGVVLEPSVVGEQLLAIAVKERALAPGERIGIVYGAGPGGTGVDRYAEREARLYFAVDGDGDGVRSIVRDSPTVRVLAARAARLLLTLPTTALPGDAVRLTVAVLDLAGNAGVDYSGDVILHDIPAGLELPTRIHLAPEHRGHLTVTGRVDAAGIFRISGEAKSDPEILRAESNPLVVRPGIAPVLWADLHGHSNLSDGTGTPEDYYVYARDVAALDVVALTDHDHWGMPFIDENPEMWKRIREATAAYHEPGRFVTLLGYEWTSWLQGHRHVLYFDDPIDGIGSLMSMMDPRYQRPDQLWQALAGKPALTFAHHSAGGPISTNWTFVPPPEIEPVTEITSVHGSSEASDSPGPIYSPVQGNFVRDVLDAGYRFGFIGSGDSHDGHPGLAMLATGAGVGGLAAIGAEARTREAVLSALRARRTYATNGERIYLDVQRDARPDGEKLTIRISAPHEIERIDFIRGGLTASVPGDGQRDVLATREIPKLGPSEYLYLRVVLVNGGAAWSSPFYGD